MKRALTTFLLWLLIAALPLQGMAAAMQASCAATAHQGQLMESAPAHHHDGAIVVHHDGMEHHHDSSAYKKGSCSACAACCTAAIALPSFFNPVPAHCNAMPAASFPTPHIASHIPPGLERPPRRMNA